MSVIALSHITKDYGGGHGVFDVSFAVEQGEVFGFLGPNGAGKTTTIRQLMGFLAPDSGTCTINGLDCRTQTAAIQKNMGYIPGEPALPDDMRGGEFIRFLAAYRGMRGTGRAGELCERFELDASGRIRRMSKGMKQKVAIVCALMHDPAVLILDEPTSGLDPLMQNRFIDLILEEKQRGKTVLMSSHMFEEVERTCARVGILREGRLAAVEEIGTLKALGFRDRRILWHYTSYGFMIGLFGCALGVALGYGIAAIVISPSGMMSTYFDLPDWSLMMPGFCIPVILITITLLTLISFLSVKKMLKGTAADALRPYEPKVMKKSMIERWRLWGRFSFGTKWNLRDIIRHKSRSAMTLIGVVGCMVLLVGGLGMKDTMDDFMRILDLEISNYTTKVSLSETAQNSELVSLAADLNGDWVASAGVSLEGETVVLEVYHAENGLIRFIDENNDRMTLTDDGVYLCQRLKDMAKIGDMIEFSPYGSEKTYSVRVAGYLRSVLSETIVMTDTYAGHAGIDYHITSVFTGKAAEEIENSPMIAGKQEKQRIMDTYDSFMDIMNVMVLMFVAAAIVLGIVVLYNLGVMSYIERSRELATLKVLGFRDRHIGKLLISQNIWLTLLGVILGFPAGIGVLQALLVTLADEYELKLCLGILTYSVSLLVTFGVSLAVGLMVTRKNKKIDMVGALKGAE